MNVFFLENKTNNALKFFTAYLVAKFLYFIIKFFITCLVSMVDSWGKYTSFLWHSFMEGFLFFLFIYLYIHGFSSSATFAYIFSFSTTIYVQGRFKSPYMVVENEISQPLVSFANWIPDFWRVVEDWFNICFVGFFFCDSTTPFQVSWRKFCFWVLFLLTILICVFHFRHIWHYRWTQWNSFCEFCS